MAEKLGHRLAMARHTLSLSQREVAAQAQISQKHLSQLERGHVSLLSLASGTVRRLARILKVSTDHLTGMDLPDSELEVADAA